MHFIIADNLLMLVFAKQDRPIMFPQVNYLQLLPSGQLFGGPIGYVDLQRKRLTKHSLINSMDDGIHLIIMKTNVQVWLLGHEIKIF